MNWYAYCCNNPVNYTDPSGNWLVNATIPIKSIRDSIGENPYEDVKSFLKGCGFFNRWQHIILSGVWINGENYECIFEDACDVGADHLPYYDKAPISINISYVGNFPVVVVDDLTTTADDGTLSIKGFGLLNMRTINKIMEKQFNDIRSTNPLRWGWMSWYKAIMDNGAITSFRSGNKISNFLFNGKIYDYTEINYIGAGYAATYYQCIYKLSPLYNILTVFSSQFWNLYKHFHFAGDDQYWFMMGMYLCYKQAL
jgi:hypothetical protein